MLLMFSALGAMSLHGFPHSVTVRRKGDHDVLSMIVVPCMRPSLHSEVLTSYFSEWYSSADCAETPNESRFIQQFKQRDR